MTEHVVFGLLAIWAFGVLCGVLLAIYKESH